MLFSRHLILQVEVRVEVSDWLAQLGIPPLRLDRLIRAGAGACEEILARAGVELTRCNLGRLLRKCGS